MEPPNEFDVESEEGDDGDLVLRGAPPIPPDLPPSPPPTAPPEVRRIGRPRKERPAPPPLLATSGPPNLDITKRDDDWPRDLQGLWMHIIAWAKKAGYGPEALVIYVHQMRGALGTPMQMATPIYGEQAMGSDEMSAGEALLNIITDDYHMPTTMEAASYRIEVRWRANGLKIKTSEPFTLDKKERIERQRYAAEQRRMRDGGPMPPMSPMFAGHPQAFGGPAQYGYSGMYPAQPRMPQASGQQAQASDVAAVPPAPVAAVAPPIAPAPPPTGNLYLDQYIADLRATTERLEARLQEKDERFAAQIQAKEREIAYLQPPPPPPPVAVTPTIADKDAEQAKLAVTISQTVMQTLIAAGVIPKPPAAGAPAPPAPSPPPTQEAAGAAVSTIRANTGTLETVLDELERAEKLKTRMRTFLGVKEQPEDDEEVANPTEFHVEPAEKEMKVWKIPNGSGGFINLPRYDKNDDETTTAQKILNFFGSNPDVTKDVVGHVMGIAMTRLSDGPLAGLIGQLITQGGAGAVAAGMARNAVNGAGGGPHGGGAGSA